MNSDILLFGGVFAIFLYVGGYKPLAIVLAIGVLLFAILSGRSKPAPVPRGGGSGQEMLEPIIIESTRGPQYRIPPTMAFYVNPFSAVQAWYMKVTRIGAFGTAARRAGRALGRPSHKSEWSKKESE